MLPILSIVGNSNSGKTTLAEKIIKSLSKKGYNLATIKHHHFDFEIDKPNKDTWKHQNAGANISIISSPYKIGLIKKVKEEYSLDDIISFTIKANKCKEIDLVVTEGYKHENKPKIQVIREIDDLKRIPKYINTIAIVMETNSYNKYKSMVNIPCFDWNDHIGIVNFIIDYYKIF